MIFCVTNSKEAPELNLFMQTNFARLKRLLPRNPFTRWFIKWTLISWKWLSAVKRAELKRTVALFASISRYHWFIGIKWRKLFKKKALRLSCSTNNLWARYLFLKSVDACSSTILCDVLISVPKSNTKKCDLRVIYSFL